MAVRSSNWSDRVVRVALTGVVENSTRRDPPDAPPVHRRDDLSGGVSFQHCLETVASLVERKFEADLRGDPRTIDEGEQVDKFLARSHSGAFDPNLEEEETLQVGAGLRTAGGAAADQSAAGT